MSTHTPPSTSSLGIVSPAARAAKSTTALTIRAYAHQTSTGTQARANAVISRCLSPAARPAKNPGVLRIRTRSASTVRNLAISSHFSPDLLFYFMFADRDLMVDKNNDYCQSTGWGSTWCQPPPEYPPETCPDKQKWCADKKECECPSPMWWDDSDKKCKYQPMPEPSCPPLQSPYCGKSKEKWCSYGEFDLFCCILMI